MDIDIDFLKEQIKNGHKFSLKADSITIERDGETNEISSDNNLRLPFYEALTCKLLLSNDPEAELIVKDIKQENGLTTFLSILILRSNLMTVIVTTKNSNNDMPYLFDEWRRTRKNSLSCVIDESVRWLSDTYVFDYKKYSLEEIKAFFKEKATSSCIFLYSELKNEELKPFKEFLETLDYVFILFCLE